MCSPKWMTWAKKFETALRVLVLACSLKVYTAAAKIECNLKSGRIRDELRIPTLLSISGCLTLIYKAFSECALFQSYGQVTLNLNSEFEATT